MSEIHSTSIKTGEAMQVLVNDYCSCVYTRRRLHVQGLRFVVCIN